MRIVVSQEPQHRQGVRSHYCMIAPERPPRPRLTSLALALCISLVMIPL